MRKMGRLFLDYNLKYWMRNKFQILLNIIGISISIAVVLAIQLLTVYNINNIKDNAKAMNGGDISISIQNSELFDDQLSRIENLKNEGKIDFTSSVFNLSNIRYENRSSNIILRFVDKSKFPFYYLDAKKVNLDNLLMDNNIILSENIAARLAVKKNDTIKIYNNYSGEDEEFIVSEIIKSDGENAYDMNIFGYAFLDNRFKNKFTGEKKIADKIYIKVKEESNVEGISEELDSIFNVSEINTYNDILESSRKDVETTQKALMIIGMLTFIIAGIGIAVTILLSILKRKKEFVILKVLGMKNIYLIYFTLMESVIITNIANIIGIPLGIYLTKVVNSLVYQNSITSINIKNYMIVIVSVIVLSNLISIIFSVIPINIISNIKAIDILREQKVEASKKIKFMKLILIMTVLLGIIFSIFLGSIVGIIYSSMILILGGVLYSVVIGILKIISIIPIKRNKILIFTMKELKYQRKRTALILITMIIGVSSIGITLNIRESILPNLEKSVENQFGYNILVNTSRNEISSVENMLDNENINNYALAIKDNVILKTKNNQKLAIEVQEYNKYAVRNIGIEGIELDKYIGYNDVEAGRWLNESDNEKNSIVINSDLANIFGIQVNDELGVLLNQELINFKVVGIKKKTFINTGGIVCSYETLEKYINGNSIRYYVNVEDKVLNDTFLKLSEDLENSFVLNVNDMMPSINTIIDSQITILLYMAILCIFSAVCLMSNMILIASLDRINEFILLKVMGAKYRDISKIIVMENILIGIIGAVISIIIVSVISKFAILLLFKFDYISSWVINIVLVIISIFIGCLSSIIVLPNIKTKKLIDILRAE